MRNAMIMTATAVLVGSVVLSGCTSTVTGTATPPSERPSATAGPGAPATPEFAQLHTALLTLADLPAGWTSGSEAERDGGGMASFRTCLGAPDGRADRLSEASSPAFTDESAGSRLYSAVASFRSQQRVEDDRALFGDLRASHCFNEALLADADAPPGSRFGKPHTTVTAGSGGGPDNVLASTTTSLPVVLASGEEMTLHFEYVFLAGRAVEGVIGFGTVDAPPDPGLRSSVVDAMARRVAAL